MVVEAVPERLEIKREVFKQLDQLAKDVRDLGQQLVVAADERRRTRA